MPTIGRYTPASATMLAQHTVPEGLARPPKRHSRAFTAALAALILIVVGGLGWWLLSRGPEPVRFHLNLTEGNSLLYRVETTSSRQVSVRGSELDRHTQSEGLLKLDVLRLRGSGADARGELTVISHIRQGTLVPAPPRFSTLPLRLGTDGSVVGALFSSKESYPVLTLPALTPILPDEEMVPGDVSAVENVRVLFSKEARWVGETRFVSYDDEVEVPTAVLEGTLTANPPETRLMGPGYFSVSIRSTVEPSTGAVLQAEGTFYSSSVFKNSGKRVVTTETFRLLPA